MAAFTPRTAAALRRASAYVCLALVLAANRAIALESLSPPAGIQPLTIPFSIDRRLPSLLPSLEEAARKLRDSRCQEVLADFADPGGERLNVRLAAAGQTLPGYLGYVLFYDGRATRPCTAHDVLAWTMPGSRAVFICWDQFAAQQRASAGTAANILIHETLHTLGLGENPPDAREITAQVAARCGR
jgi:hypothetical protein